MKACRFILTLVVFFLASPWLASQQAPPAGQPMATYPAASPPVFGAPPSFPMPPTYIQPGPQGTTIYPPGSTVVPLPSQAAGSIFGPPAAPAGPIVTVPQPGGIEQLPVPSGASSAPVIVGPGPPGAIAIPGPPGPPGAIAVPGPPNPISVPVVDDDLAWDQIADVVSDYFTISREQRARRGEAAMEGCIETAPQDGATVLEPHRSDSVGWFNRWESTFQSIRRRATVRVIPDVNGYLVDVIVEKELEDLAKPEKSTAGAATFRTDGSLPSSRLEEVSRTHQSSRWISLGRDAALEQRILSEIHARLNGITNSRASVFSP